MLLNLLITANATATASATAADPAILLSLKINVSFFSSNKKHNLT
jgi:hypothetical protein